MDSPGTISNRPATSFVLLWQRYIIENRALLNEFLFEMYIARNRSRKELHI
jgi:hypothetical protein